MSLTPYSFRFKFLRKVFLFYYWATIAKRMNEGDTITYIRRTNSENIYKKKKKINKAKAKQEKKSFSATAEFSILIVFMLKSNMETVIVVVCILQVTGTVGIIIIDLLTFRTKLGARACIATIGGMFTTVN